MPRMILHIGAHKTATSYMQKKLALNVDLLNRRNIHYDRLDVMRKEFTPLLNESVTRESEWIRELRGTARAMNILISEENILGVPGDIVRESHYYIRSRQRLARTCQLFGNDKPEIFLALRDYAGFTVSMYSEYIRHREFLKFEDYLKIYEASGFSWIRIIEDIFAVVPGATLTVWNFADFRRLEKSVFQAMLGFDPDILSNPEGPVRESFSEVAVRAFAALSGALTHAEMKKLINPIARNLPKGEEYPAFDPHLPETKERMRAQFKDDLATIATRFPQVSFIT
ncbi:hypothetical protein [Rhizobium sp.]